MKTTNQTDNSSVLTDPARKLPAFRSRISRILFFLFLSVLPLSILCNGYDAETGWIRLIFFGQIRGEERIAAIRELQLPELSPLGYDGQFYAQIAMDPSLQNRELVQALDKPAYRARRIGLPFLAHYLGGEKPFGILQAYALLNTAFWVLFLFILRPYFGMATLKDALLYISLLWSTGVLTSVARSLPDLPAAVFTTWSLLSPTRPATVFLGIAALFKETAVLGFPNIIRWERKNPKSRIRHVILSAIIVFTPLLIWIHYVYNHFPVDNQFGYGNFSFPLTAWFQKVVTGLSAATHVFDFPSWGYRLFTWFELACPISLFLQSAYMVIRYQPSSAAWRAGIGFAILFCFLGESVWADQYAYSRVLLPLTISFAIQVHQREKGGAFIGWFVAGNAGMAWGFLETVGRMFY